MSYYVVTFLAQLDPGITDRYLKSMDSAGDTTSGLFFGGAFGSGLGATLASNFGKLGLVLVACMSLRVWVYFRKHRRFH